MHIKNISLGIWIGLAFVAIWRQLLKKNKLQVILHQKRWLGLVLQWHTIFLLGAAVAIVSTLYEFLVRFADLDHHELRRKLLQAYHAPCNGDFRGRFEDLVHQRKPAAEAPDPAEAPDFAAHFLHKLEVPAWLWYANSASMFVGLAVLVVVGYHVFQLIVLPSRNLALKHPTWKHIQWAPTKRTNWLLIIILMPLAFSASVMRANCRLWGLLSGQSPRIGLDEFTYVEASMYAEYFSDLEIGAICQFCTVYAFARITSAVLSDTTLLHQHLQTDVEASQRGSELDVGIMARDYKNTILYAGFLGVWAFVVLGVLRSILDLAFCIFRTSERFSMLGDSLYATWHGSLTTIFSAFTFLCVVNMAIICHSPIVRHKLGGASKKFLGTRILLLVMDMQQKLLDAFVYGSALYQHVQEVGGKLRIETAAVNIHSFGHSDELSKLKNLTFLNFWILIVAIFNLAMWSSLDLESSGFAKFHQVKEVLPDSETDEKSRAISGPLLDKLKCEAHDDDPWDF